MPGSVNNRNGVFPLWKPIWAYARSVGFAGLFLFFSSAASATAEEGPIEPADWVNQFVLFEMSYQCELIPDVQRNYLEAGVKSLVAADVGEQAANRVMEGARLKAAGTLGLSAASPACDIVSVDLLPTLKLAKRLYDDRVFGPAYEDPKAPTVVKEAQAGNPMAQALLGWMYLEGDEVEKDAAKAIQWLEKAAKQGQAETYYTLGMIYLEGNGTGKDIAKANHWLDLAAKSGDATAALFLGQNLIEGAGGITDTARGLSLLEPLAEAGDESAILSLKMHYAWGKARDCKKELFWTEAFASQGAEGSKSMLGNLYLKLPYTCPELFGWADDQGEKYQQQGVEILASAIDEGDLMSASELGDAYLRGFGTQKNVAKAIEYFLIAANDGDDNRSWSTLGDLYADHPDVPSDYEKAYFWYGVCLTHSPQVCGYYLAKQKTDSVVANLDSATRARIDSDIARWSVRGRWQSMLDEPD